MKVEVLNRIRDSVVLLIRYLFRSWSGTVQKIWKFADTCLPVHSVAWRVASEPVELLLNEPDPIKQDHLTEIWRTSMLQQLKMTALSSALVATLIVTAFSWQSIPILLPAADSALSKRFIPIPWYMALLFALTSLASATNQAIAIHRLAVYPNSLARIRSVLGSGCPSPNTRADPWQMWTWHIPATLLNGSIYMLLAGLVTLFWNIGKLGVSGLGSDDVKVNIAFEFVLSLCISGYAVASSAIYYKVRIS